jgi:major type 1 subunit fimbrin (pilin)
VSGELNIRSRLAGVASGAVLALALTGARAADGTITFTGAVTGNSCTMQVGTDQARPASVFEITVGGCIASRADPSATTPAPVTFHLQAVPRADQSVPALIDAAPHNAQVKLYMQSHAGAITWSLVYD